MRKTLYLTGPTASGKTGRAVSLARKTDAEIISVDSRQVYRGMDLGTGKDLAEYNDVPYHLIDIAEAGEKYNLWRYLRDYRQAEKDIRRRGKNVISCGGTGLYLETIINGIKMPEVPENPELRSSLAQYSLEELTAILGSMKKLHNRTDTDTRPRAIRAIEIQTYMNQHPEEAALAKPLPEKAPVIVVVDIPREKRRERIFNRLESRLKQGMVEEVKGLLDNGVDPATLIGYGLEYKYLTLYVKGELTYDLMQEQLYTAICQFAKRQMTWFRGMERRGFRLRYVPFDLPEEEFNDKVLEIWREGEEE